MRFGILLFALLALSLVSTQANAASSCSSFAVIKSYDADAKTVEISYEKGKLAKYFPRPEGASQERSMVPKKCRSKVKKTTTLKVKLTGGRMTVKRLGPTPVPAAFVTATGPLVVPSGTTASISVSESTVKAAAATSWNITEVAPVNPLPVSATVVPAAPTVGAIELITGT